MDGKSIVSEIVDKVAPEEEEKQDGGDLSEALLTAAEDVLDVIDPYGSGPSEPEPRADETPLQKQQREIDRRASEERRRAKAEILGRTLKAFFDLCEAGEEE